MKAFLILIILLVTNFIYSQIGVVTVRKKDKTVPIGMWFVSTEKERKNQMYYMSECEVEINNVLINVFKSVLYNKVDYPLSIDNFENPYWCAILNNGYYVTIYLDKPTSNFKYHMITIITEKQ